MLESPPTWTGRQSVMGPRAASLWRSADHASPTITVCILFQTSLNRQFLYTFAHEYILLSKNFPIISFYIVKMYSYSN